MGDVALKSHLVSQYTFLETKQSQENIFETEITTHQRCFKVRCRVWRPCLRHNAVDGVLLRTIYRLHKHWRGKLCLCLDRLSINTGIQYPVTILCKKCVDGFYPGLQEKAQFHTMLCSLYKLI